MGKFRFYNTEGDATPPAAAAAAAPAPAPEATKRSDVPIDELLQAGLVVGGTIARQRQQSGRSANRQARIAACGRKPLFGKKKKAAYNQCLADAQAGVSAATRSGDLPIDTGEGQGDSGNKTMQYVGIGLGVVVLGVVGFILYKKFGK